MEIEKLKYLLTIEEERSISKAADKLFMSQPSLSKYLTSIEGMLGFKIFKRTAAGYVPTHLGERYLMFARDAVALENRTMEDLDRIRAEQKKSLIVFGLAHTRNAIAIPNALHIQKPDVQLMIRILRDEELLEGLQDGSIDFALLTMPYTGEFPPGIRFKEVYSERLLIAVSTNNPLSEKGVEKEGERWPYLAPEFLRDQVFILSGHGTGLRDLSKIFFQAEQITPDVRLIEDSVLAAQRFAEKEWGICFVTEEIALLEPSEKLRYFVTNDTLPIRHVCFAWSKTTEADPLRFSILQNNVHVLSQR